MTVQTALEIAGLIVGGGGGASVISKVTRLVVAVEQLAEQSKVVIAELQDTKTAVQDHEVRLAKGNL